MDLLSWIAGLPPWQMYAAFLTFAVVRGCGYYAAGALAGRRAHGPRWTEARDKVGRLGARAVIVTWPVYGLAAATQVASGAVRVSPRAFGAALLLMSLIWAGLQTVLGVALLEALASQAAPAVVALLAVLIIGRLALDRHRRRQSVVAAGV